MCKASRSRNINRKITTTASHSRIEFRNWRDGLRAVGVGASAPTGGDLAGSPADVAVTAKAKPIAAPANATTIPAVPDHFPLLYLPRLWSATTINTISPRIALGIAILHFMMQVSRPRYPSLVNSVYRKPAKAGCRVTFSVSLTPAFGPKAVASVEA